MADKFSFGESFFEFCVLVDEFVVVLEDEVDFEFQIFDLFLLYVFFVGGVILTGVVGAMGRDIVKSVRVVQGLIVFFSSVSGCQWRSIR